MTGAPVHRSPRTRQRLVNLLLFAVIGQYAVREALGAGVFSSPRLVDAAFFAHNLVFLAVILLRREHREIDREPRHWIVALLSFFSNFFFVKGAAPGGAAAPVAEAVTWLALLAGTAALLSLGRSFGIVPAVRAIKTNGAYRVVRHPMYLSDILFKVPMALKYASLWNLAVLALSAGLYLLRIRFEEDLLMGHAEYRSYAQKVRYRLVPLIY